MTSNALLESSTLDQKVNIDIIIALAKIKISFVNADDNLTKQIKAAIISSATEVIEQKHNKQFPLSIYSANIHEKINNNINEVIAYLINRKINKEVNINILNFNNSALQLVDTAINIVFINNIENSLFKGITKLSSYFWAIKKNNDQPKVFSRRINLDIAENLKENNTKIDNYNKQLSNQKNKVYESVLELMSLHFEINYLNNKMIDILNNKLRMKFLFNNNDLIFYNLVYLELDSKIKMLSIIIFKILKCEFNEIYKKYYSLHLLQMKHQLKTLDDLNNVNNVIIFEIINNNISSLVNIINLCKI